MWRCGDMAVLRANHEVRYFGLGLCRIVGMSRLTSIPLVFALGVEGKIQVWARAGS